MQSDVIPLEVIESEELALELAEDYYLAEKSLSHFIRSAWQVLEPQTNYLHNWHIDAMAEYLEAVELGQIRRLIINVPPRYMKSIAVSVCYPAWVWLRNPSERFICGAYSASLSTKHSVDRRALIESPWYQAAWKERFHLSQDQNQKTEFSNNHRGHMVATSVGSSAIGKGGNRLIFDDPLNPAEAASDLQRESANTWIDNFTTRLDDKRTGAIIGVMQRLHEKDPAGHLLGKGDWEVLSLPAEAKTRTTIVFPVSKREVIREEGDLLWPEREGVKEHEAMKRALGSMGYQAQYQQDPRPAAGGFFKRSWWKYYSELPKDIFRTVELWDCAEEPGLSNDYTVCAVWGESPTGYYLIDLFREKVAFPQLERACQTLHAKHLSEAIVIEKKSAGTQLIQNLLAKTTLPILKFDPAGRSKVVRASGAQPTVEAGNCYLPDNRGWVEVFISEHEKFPNSEHDDQVDTTSMMVEHFKRAIPQPRIRTL